MPTQYSMQWFVQREVPGQIVLALSYLGNSNHHMGQLRDINQPLTPGSGSVKSRSPWPFFGRIILQDSAGNGSHQSFNAA